MGERVRIVKYSKTHWKEVRTIINEVTSKWGKEWKQHMLKFYNPRNKFGDDVFRYVALVNGRLVATMSVKSEVDACVIYFLAVKKEFREIGMGGKLINFAERFAKRKKLSIMRVDTAEDFAENIKFYKWHGFKVSGKVRNVYVKADSHVFLWKKV